MKMKGRNVKNCCSKYRGCLVVVMIVSGLMYINELGDTAITKERYHCKLSYHDGYFPDKNILATNTSSTTETVANGDDLYIDIPEHYLKKITIPDAHVPNVNCTALSKGDMEQLNTTLRFSVPDTRFIVLAKNCEEFIRYRQYTMRPVSEEEADFPIAYSIFVNKDVEQVERLLRVIYRPQNFYCIHINKSATIEIELSVADIVKCFSNVFLSSSYYRSVNVVWGTYSVLEAELICMRDLWKYKWKYFINLTGQDFPLQTNWDIVKILKVFNGANSLNGTVKRSNMQRTSHIDLEPPLTVSITLTKGSVHIIVQRGFVDYVLHNQTTVTFLKWLKNTSEIENEKIEDVLTGIRNPYLARFKIDRQNYPHMYSYDCQGKYVRGLCIFGDGDLQTLVNRKELFAHKFQADYQRLVYDCLEELHFTKTKEEMLGTRVFDTSFYEKLDIVKNQV